MQRFALISAFLGAIALASTAQARSNDAFAYRYEHVWSAAVRLLRVDFSCAIQERDPEVGFVVFDYTENKRQYPGSLEVVATEIEGRKRVRVVVHIPAMPTYIERMMLDRLKRKLLEEFGDPLRDKPKAPKEPKEPEDEDEDDKGRPGQGPKAEDEPKSDGKEPARW